MHIALKKLIILSAYSIGHKRVKKSINIDIRWQQNQAQFDWTSSLQRFQMKNINYPAESKQNFRQISIQNSLLTTDATEITKRLYIGDRACAANYEFLRQIGVKNIVVAGEELSPHFPTSFEYLHVRVKDSPKEEISQHFDSVCSYIKKGLERGEGVLVHCAFGVSRSATFVIAFLMKQLKIAYLDAFSYVRRKRPVIRPNAGFQEQLQLWERRDFKSL